MDVHEYSVCPTEPMFREWEACSISENETQNSCVGDCHKRGFGCDLAPLQSNDQMYTECYPGAPLDLSLIQ